MKLLFATTSYGLEELLKQELQALGATECRVAQGGVYFHADETVMYQTLLWSRLASRILLVLSQFAIYSEADLYACALQQPWSKHFSVDNSLLIHFNGTNAFIRNTQYGALRIKDAIVDHFMQQCQRRPNIDKKQPDIRIHAHLNKQKLTLALDLSGDSLHLRGYRPQAGAAPLRENLAAAVVLRSGWKIGEPLVDPMCGSGTLLIEAAMMAADIAPGLARTEWGFKAWREFNPSLWNQLRFAARERAQQGIAAAAANFFGSDNDSKMIAIAKQNAQCAGVAELIQFESQDALQLQNPSPNQIGVVLSNPPYGERLESEPALIALHSALGAHLKQQFAGWRLSLISANAELLNCIALRADKQIKFKNGPLDCVQKNYQLSAKSANLTPAEPKLAAEDFANRLRKNLQKLSRWAKQQQIDCYRVYDADLPEYNVAIDRYQDYYVIQEYAPPKQIDADKARQRLFNIINATIAVCQVPAQQVILKTRQRQKGKQQYQKLAQKQQLQVVHEYGAKFWVNLTDYLDTGLFLDHRLARKMLAKMAQGKDFLNLFAYTGSATVHAALGGAKSTTTVDMSRTYLAWAQKNLELNQLTGRQHRFIQADCLQYLAYSEEQFDLIFIDPPTFSNSKRMQQTFDVQRDQALLMQHLKRLLKPGGKILFSNNKRGFKIDAEALAQQGLQYQDITAETIPLDFARNRQIHHCFLLQEV